MPAFQCPSSTPRPPTHHQQYTARHQTPFTFHIQHAGAAVPGRGCTATEIGHRHSTESTPGMRLGLVPGGCGPWARPSPAWRCQQPPQRPKHSSRESDGSATEGGRCRARSARQRVRDHTHLTPEPPHPRPTPQKTPNKPPAAPPPPTHTVPRPFIDPMPAYVPP